MRAEAGRAGSLRRIAWTATLLAAIGACGSPDASPESAAQWTPPAWFAEQARQREEMAASLQSCMEQLGWAVTMNEFGGTDTPFTDGDELARFESDSADCQEQAGRDLSQRTEEEIRQDYQKDLDTLECLRAQGFDMADPPSEESYVESRLATPPPDDAWLPYGDPAIQDALVSGELTDEDVAALERKCPQNWG